jgi:multidrug efflux pump subunit AcrA (membrane-fusion protein)
LPLDDRQVQADTRYHLTHEFVDRNADIALVSDRAINVTGKVREVASSVDLAAGTVRVKIGIELPPPAMTLGAVITRTGRLKPRKRIILPWSTLASQDGKPAVWVVDPHSRAVALRRVTIDAYQTGEIILRPNRDRFAKLLCRPPPPLANACLA